MFQKRSVYIWPGEAVLCADWMDADNSELFYSAGLGKKLLVLTVQDRVQMYRHRDKATLNVVSRPDSYYNTARYNKIKPHK